MSRKRTIAIGCVLALASAACSSSSSSAEGGIAVTEQDFSISVSPSSTTAGEISFTITNNGPSAHEFVIVKTDEDPASFQVAHVPVGELAGLATADTRS